MVVRRVLLSGVVALVLALSACSGDEEKATPTATPTSPALSVRDAWVRATIQQMAGAEQSDTAAGMAGHDMGGMSDQEPSGRVTGAFMVIENSGDAPDRLIGASAGPEVAGAVEIHETTVDENDVMRMRPIEAIEVPARGSVELKPGGYHIMLLDVQRDLNPGDTVTLTLTFASGATLDVTAEVRALE